MPIGVDGLRPGDNDEPIDDDAYDADVTVRAIFQDEPVGAEADGYGIGRSQATLRAERSDTSGERQPANGRVYHVRFTADFGRNRDDRCDGVITVSVPVLRQSPAIDDGPLFDSTVADVPPLPEEEPPPPPPPPPPTTADVHVQLIWDTTADLDVHLLHPNGSWNSSPWDCYWANQHPNWGDLSTTTDDPAHDLDDTDGFGPENITLSNLERGITYRAAGAYFTSSSSLPTTATMRVFVRGALVEELTTRLPGSGYFWEAAAITFDGIDVSVTPTDQVSPS